MHLVIFNTLSVLSIGLFVVFAVLLLTLVFRTHVGKAYRSILADALENTRMHGLLKAIGIHTNDYIGSHDIIDLHKHLNACTACSRSLVCESKVASGSLNAQTINFCENRDGIARVMLQKGA